MAVEDNTQAIQRQESHFLLFLAGFFEDERGANRIMI